MTGWMNFSGDWWVSDAIEAMDVADTAGMRDPVRCARCSHVYDLAAVEVTARYADCSMWRCPGCRALVDDRGETGWKSVQDYYRIRGAQQ